VSTANFIFHGLFPDHIEANEGTSENSGKQICKILFDVDFEGEFHSHLLADLWPVEEGDNIPTYEVRYELPFHCEDFSKTVVKYYQQIIGPQSNTISHSGPKGMNPRNNVFRAQWQVDLPARKK
jgi:hypothetical protein